MAYTIVGMFPTNEDADNASSKLDISGFSKEDYQVSRYTREGKFDENSNYDFKEDENTTGFWNWLFGSDEDEKGKYSYAGSKSNLVTVYANDLDAAEKARDIMNEEGAINVNEFTKDRFNTEEKTSSTELSSSERARIISKAKNNLYLTGGTRTYTVSDEGMSNDMDHQGNKDTF